MSKLLALTEFAAIHDAHRDEIDIAVRTHARFVYRLAYSVLRNHHDAEDVAQETFIRAMKARIGWTNVRDPRAWLARTCWRIANKRLTQTPATLDLEAQHIAEWRASGIAADEIAATGEMASMLRTLIASLPRDLRDTLILSLAEEMKSVEIARVLGIREGSVRTRLLRARQLLRHKLFSLLEAKRER